MRLRRYLILILAGVSLVALAGHVSAAANDLPSAITVAPAIEQLQLADGQDSAEFPVTVINHTKQLVQVKLGFADFKALNKSGGVAFLSQSSGDLSQRHGLLNWVQLDTQQIGLNPGQSSDVIIHLINLTSLPPGGHYGAVTYQIVGHGTTINGNRVSIDQVLSSLVFVSTASGGIQHLQMLSPAVDHLALSIPNSLDLFFTNDGNVQTAPRGSLAIYAHDRRQPVATGIVNSGSALVLPNSTRLLNTPLTRVGHPWWPRRYHLEIRYRPDSASQFAVYQTTFWYVNPLAVLASLAVIIAGGYVLLRHRRRSGRVLKKLAHTLRIESILLWRDGKLLAGNMFKRSRKIIHTLRIETILIWRDFKLLIRYLIKVTKRRLNKHSKNGSSKHRK